MTHYRPPVYVPDEPSINGVRAWALVAAFGLGSALAFGPVEHSSIWLTLFTAPAGLAAVGFLAWMDHDHKHGGELVVLPYLMFLFVGMLFGGVGQIVGLPALGGMTWVANWLPLAATMCLGWPDTHNRFTFGAP